MIQQSTTIRKEDPNDCTASSSPLQGQDASALGQKRLQRFPMLQTKSAMTTDVLAVPLWMTLDELERLFETHDFNGFPVVEGPYLIGFVTKFDFLKNFILNPNSIVPHYDELMKRTVAEIMTRQISTVHPRTPLTRVLQRMVETRNKSFPVVDDDNRLLGVISRGDVIRALQG